jgi:hypothetical protein
LGSSLAVVEAAQALCANAGVSTLNGDVIPSETVDALRDSLSALNDSEGKI